MSTTNFYRQAMEQEHRKFDQSFQQMAGTYLRRVADLPTDQQLQWRQYRLQDKMVQRRIEELRFHRDTIQSRIAETNLKIEQLRLRETQQPETSAPLEAACSSRHSPVETEGCTPRRLEEEPSPASQTPSTPSTPSETSPDPGPSTTAASPEAD